MVNGIRKGDLCGFNKRRSSKFRVNSRVRQTPEEGWRIYPPERCGNNYKDEEDSPKILNIKIIKLRLKKCIQLKLSLLKDSSVTIKPIINSFWQHRFPSFYLHLRSYHILFQAGPPDYNQSFKKRWSKQIVAGRLNLVHLYLQVHRRT